MSLSTNPQLDRGDRFTRLLLANQQRIYGLILALTPNWSDADDLMQETTAVMWAKFDAFEPGTDFAAWGLRIARFQVMNYLKIKGSERRRFSNEAVELIVDKFTETVDELEDRRDALKRCMDKLPAKDRKLIQLRYEVGTTTRTLADRVGRSIHAVYKALNRTHAQLLACMQRSLNHGGN
ncbi:MAG: sigma-70 family RNA polymerase sigma factor [Phycisphaeraceae bacterium]